MERSVKIEGSNAMADNQRTFGQDSLALAGDQVRIRELTGLPLAAGLRETLLALNAAGGDLATTRADLAERLGVHPSTVSRRAARLVASGLLLRVAVGAEVAWRIDWVRVLDYDGAAEPQVKSQKSKVKSAQAEFGAELLPELVRPAVRGELHVVERGVWARRVVLACLVIPVTIARLVLRLDAAVRVACDRVTLGESAGNTLSGVVAGGERTGAGSVRAGRVRMAGTLPFTGEVRVGPGAAGVQTGSGEVSHSPQLADKDLANKSASSSSGGSSEGRKKYIAIDWDLCRDRSGKGPSLVFSKLVGLGHISSEDAESFHQFLNSVRRRACPSELLAGEKHLKKPAGYIAHVVGDGTWRDDIRREDREWFAGVVEQTRRQQVVGCS
jgi:DNA-binding MarR family transcriptional regulator